MSLISAIDKLKAVREEIIARDGESTFNEALTFIQKKPKVNPERGTKIGFTWTQTKRQAQSQKWLCPCCGLPLRPITGHSPDSTVGDHINPNLTEEEGLNDPRMNLAAMHRKCNEEKGSMSVYEYAKRKGLTITHILSGGIHG